MIWIVWPFSGGLNCGFFFLGASERFSVAFDVHVVGAFCDQLKFELSDC